MTKPKYPEMTGDQKKDIESLLYADLPVAFGRLADGEVAILMGNDSIVAADGWKVSDSTDGFIRGLLSSLEHDQEGYYLGLSDGKVDEATQYYLRSHRKLPNHRWTSSNLFVNDNHSRFLEILTQKQWLQSATWVVSDKALKKKAKNPPAKKFGQPLIKVPSDVLNTKWHPGRVVDKLLNIKTPIMVCAGPASSIIISEYWRYQHPDSRQTILDIGSAMDVLLHGRATRGYLKKEKAK